MKKDIYERMKTLKREGIKPNYAEVAKIYGCDYRTVKKCFDRNENQIREKLKRPSKLDGFEDTIKKKLEIPCAYTAIYEFIKKKGFQGKYTILKVYCNQYKMEQTHKGKVETLAKVIERLRVYNNEFENLDELDEIVKDINNDLNNEISQGTNEIPLLRFKNEKEHLNPLPNHEILNGFITKPVTRKVTKESMNVYNKSKYSLPTKYIGKTVSITINNDILQIYYNSLLVSSHKISENYLNYHKEDMIEILKSDALKGYKDEDIEKFIDKNMNIYDKLGG